MTTMSAATLVTVDAAARVTMIVALGKAEAFVLAGTAPRRGGPVAHRRVAGLMVAVVGALACATNAPTSTGSPRPVRSACDRENRLHTAHSLGSTRSHACSRAGRRAANVTYLQGIRDVSGGGGIRTLEGPYGP